MCGQKIDDKNKHKDNCCKGINVVNDTQREVAIGKIGVAAGEFANVAIVGEDGAAAAGETPEATAFSKDGVARVASRNNATS